MSLLVAESLGLTAVETAEMTIPTRRRLTFRSNFRQPKPRDGAIGPSSYCASYSGWYFFDR